MSKIPSLPSERGAWFDSAFRPLWDFYLWCKTVDARIRAGSDALAGLEQQIADTEITDGWSHWQVKAVDGDYTLFEEAPFAGSIERTVTRSQSGTCTVTLKINGSALGGTANSVSTSKQGQDHTSDNEFAAGDRITYTVSSNASCKGMSIEAHIKRPLM